MDNNEFLAMYGEYAGRLDVALKAGTDDDVADAANELANLLGVRYLSCVNHRRTLDVEFIAARDGYEDYKKLARMACEIDNAEDARVKAEKTLKTHTRIFEALAKSRGAD